MKNIIVILLLAALGWIGWTKYQEHAKADRAAERSERQSTKAPPAAAKAAAGSVNFLTCDSRNSCGQMTSCEEAKFFIQNCPGMSREGNREGTTCEQQWCK
jgi:predicted negative regulator of RcsB-dependent stress response